MINLGIDPATAGPAEWQEAADWLLMQRDSGTVRQYYDQGYIDDFVAGNTVSMAWSGDILYYKVWAGYPDFGRIFPEVGPCCGKTTCSSRRAPRTRPARSRRWTGTTTERFATMVTEWVLYLSPAGGVQELILEDAKAAEDDGYKGYANKLSVTAESQYAFRTMPCSRRQKFGANITTDKVAEEWDNIFLPITQQ